jgi:hypothetical protein
VAYVWVVEGTLVVDLVHSGPNPGPYDCCFPPPPGSPPETGYSGSRERSGCAHQSGNLVGVFTFVQLPRGCPRSGIEHLETLGSIMCLRF